MVGRTHSVLKQELQVHFEPTIRKLRETLNLVEGGHLFDEEALLGPTGVMATHSRKRTVIKQCLGHTTRRVELRGPRIEAERGI